MPRRVDQGHRLVGRPRLGGALVVALGARGLVGERVAVVAAHAPQGVEHRVDRARDPDPRSGPGYVQPPGAHPADGIGGRGRVGHEIHPPHHVDGRGRSHEVVEHVVEQPVVRWRRPPAESLRGLDDRLLLAGRELRAGRSRSTPPWWRWITSTRGTVPVGVDELGVEARDVAGLPREEVRPVQPDDVLPRLNLHFLAEGQMADAVVLDVRNRAGLVLDRRKRPRTGCGVRLRRCDRECPRCTQKPHQKVRITETGDALNERGCGTSGNKTSPLTARPCATGHVGTVPRPARNPQAANLGRCRSNPPPGGTGRPSETGSPSRAVRGDGCSPSPSWARAWPFSTAPSSTSPCPRSAATSTPRPARCSGSSTATC